LEGEEKQNEVEIMNGQYVLVTYIQRKQIAKSIDSLKTGRLGVEG
jgi:hypothetical protein